MFQSKQASVVLLGIFSIGLSPDLACNALALTAAVQGEMSVIAEYKPPQGIGAPPTSGGGTRGNKCEQDKEILPPALTAIRPDSSLANGLGWTGLESPQFFVYVLPTAARSAEFVLKDEQENDIYRTKFAINGRPGIFSVSLPKNSVKLEVGKNYHWYFAIICNPNNRRKDVSVDGWSRRVEIPASLAGQLNNVGERDRSKLYAQNSIWHEAVATLAEERRKAPNDPVLAAEWKNLLESA